MLIPLYRQKELQSIYNIYCNETKEVLPITRKKELYKVIKAKYKWFNYMEYNSFYTIIKPQEVKRYLEYQKSNFSQEYKDLICKFFSSTDQNNDLTIDLVEFQNALIILNIYDLNQINDLFNKFDINNDGFLSIDEFITLLLQHKIILEKLDLILNYKFEQHKNNEMRNLIFDNFPGSPNTSNWRPSLSNIRSLDFIKAQIIFLPKNKLR